MLLRSVAPIIWSDVYFDADQAVMGLMAKHIAERRAFPVFQYGAPYVLVLEAYLAAPLIGTIGGSPAALRLIPFAFNLATALLLYAVLTSRAGGLRPTLAVIAVAPVALPGLGGADELTSALGMNVEPLFFSLLIWVLRERPIALGIVAAIGLKNREFVLYALAALLFLDLLRDRSAALWRPRALGLVAFAIVWWGISLLYQHSAVLGPGTSAAMLEDGGSNVAVAANAVCLAPERMPGDVWMVASELLPFQWGVRSAQWRIAGHPGVQPPDATWLWLPLVGTLALAALRGLWRAWRHGPSELTWFGVFLLMVGMQAVLVYALTRCGNASFYTLRYILLSVFIASGAIVLGVERETKKAFLAGVVGVCAIWFGVVFVGHMAVLRGFLSAPPDASYRQLAEYLEENGVRYIQSDYWIGYHVAFLTEERVRATTNFDRILEHHLAAQANLDKAPYVWREDGHCTNSVRVGRFYVCPPAAR